MDFKDLFNPESVGALADAVQAVHPAFDREAFLSCVFDTAWPGRELKERMRHIGIALHSQLPGDFRQALRLLRAALPALSDQGLVKIVFPDYVELYGLDDWEASLPALEEFTQQMSAEFAIRPFIVRHPERTMAQMLAWAQHPSAEVRRLASEGCRPRLPWGIRLAALQADPAPILPILELLKSDPSESVRRSVANNLNDISKDHPEVVLDLLRRWQAEGGGEIEKTTSHALRTLVKKGHPEALALLGHSAEAAITIHNLAVEPQVVHLGEAVTLTFDIESLSDQPQDLIIDYLVHHKKADGRLTPMVFKLSRKRIAPGEVLHITKRHSFAPVTTRSYYPGEHAIEPKVNGQSFGRVSFVLKM